VWRCELHIVRPFSSSFHAKKSIESNTTRVNGLVFRCRHGIEHLYRVINMIQTRGASLSERCQLFLNEIKRLRSDEKYAKQAKSNLARHIEKLSWGIVKNVLSKTDIAHQKRKLRREFLSREYQTRFYQRAQITPKRLVVVDDHDDVVVDNVVVEDDDVQEDLEEKEEEEERPKAISSMIDMWTSKFEELGKNHRQRLQENIIRSSSMSSIRNRSISSASSSTASSTSRRQNFSSVSSVGSNTSRNRKSVLGLAESRIMRKSTNVDARRGKDGRDLPIWNHSDTQNLCQKIAIFVLGPSASGKTHMTRQNLTKILKVNGLSHESSFISIDGGIMRDCSENWRQMKRRHTREYKGFKDLFGGYFQPMVRQFKKRCFQTLLSRGVNMIIPETSVNASSTVEHYHGPATKGKVKIMFDKLKEEGYTILMTAVHASRLKCMDNGKRREVLEGKKYKNASWGVAIGSIARMFNYSRSAGYLHETLFVLDNTNWDRSDMLVVCFTIYIYVCECVRTHLTHLLHNQVPPFHGLELESMIEESPDLENDENEEDSKGKWKTYVIPKSGSLYELSKAYDNLRDGDSKKDLYYYWEPQNFEVKDQWLKNLDTGVKWDLSNASVTSYVNGVKDIVTTSESHTPRIVEHDDNVDKKTENLSSLIRTKTLSTRVNVIEISLSQKSQTHHRGNSITLSPESSKDLRLWIGTIIASCRWGAQQRKDSEVGGQLSMNL